MPKTYLDIDVYTAARRRMERVFDDFEHVYLSFSGGKDSSAMLQMAIEVAREKGRLPVDVLVVDLEAQYQHTVDFIHRMADRTDEVRMYWVCLPIHLRNAVSQLQPHWLCWDPEAEDRWVRSLPDHPTVISDTGYFPFFRTGMEFEEFVPEFGEWYAKHVAESDNVACLVGIRSDESLNRFRTIVREDKERWAGLGWTTKVSDHVYNAYPLYDWTTQDVWVAHGRQRWDYNKVYDLFQLAGLSIHEMRLCQPFGDDQRRGLWLYKMIEPDTWGKLVSRVQGANFGNRYVQLSGNVTGNIRVTLPEGYTWRRYVAFLLRTMPPPTAAHYRKKIKKFLSWYEKNPDLGFAGGIPDAADPRDEAQKKAPSWRRVAKCLLKNDYWCKSLSFSQTKREMERQLDLVMKYMDEV